MPKEVIQHPDSTDVRLGSTGGEEQVNVYTSPALTVRWGSSHTGSGGHTVPGDVQITISEFPVISKAEFHEAKSWPPDPSRETHSAGLDRAQLNALIKVLRRARDQAFGRDE
jgi:hypothetical protein